MSNSRFYSGEVIEGDHVGYRAIERGNEWLIVPSSDMFSNLHIKQIISKETVEHYFELGQHQRVTTLQWLREP